MSVSSINDRHTLSPAEYLLIANISYGVKIALLRLQPRFVLALTQLSLTVEYFSIALFLINFSPFIFYDNNLIVY